MSIVIESPKLLSVRLTQLDPLDVKHDYVYTYNASIDVTAQLHSGTNGFVKGQFDARDVKIGDYIATTSQGRVLRIQSITNVGPTRLDCVLVDEDQINSASDATQFGESAIDKDDGILFELKEGKPYLFPLPNVLPGGLTQEFAIQILSRFNFASKDKNITVEQDAHGFLVGETLSLTSTGWQPDATEPTGVVVKADDDTFSVRLYGTKTHIELPGDLGTIYYWDSVDRMLTAQPTSNTGNKLFQKIGSTEALLLSGSSVPFNVETGPHFSGNYGDLTNKPNIPSDISQLTDSTNLLNNVTNISELNNDADYTTKAYVDQQIANLDGDIDIDLDGYVTTAELNQELQNLGAHFSGDYNDLTNKPALFDGQYSNLTGAPTVPTDVNQLTDNDNIIFNRDYNALTNKPALFDGNYESLSNKPAIPSISGLATEGYVDSAVADVDTFSGDYNDLTNKPTIFDGNYNNLTNKPTLFNGNYNTLVNKPVLPTKVSDLENDEGFINTVTMTHILNALGYTPADAANVFNGDYNSLANLPVLSNYITDAAIADFKTEAEIIALINSGISGGIDLDYNDLLNKPTIPADVSDLTDTNNLLAHFSGNYQDLSNKPDLSEFITETEIDSKIASAVTGGSVDLSNYVTDAELATAIAGVSGGNVDLSDYYTKTQVDALLPTPFSGDYNDLTNKPTIPDTSTFISETEIDSKIASAVTGGTVDLSDYVTDAELATQLANYQPTIDLSSYYNKTEVDALIPTVPTDISQLTDTTNLLGSGGGSVDLTGYATETFVNQQIAAASVGGIANLDDLNDVAVGSLPQVANSEEHYLLEYNPVNQLWESKDFGEIFATQAYVTSTVATIITDGDINLDGYATEQFVEQKLTERGDHFSGNYFDLTNRPQLFSGDYNDLLNKPAGNQDLRMQLVGQELQLLNIEPDPDTVISTVDLSDLGDAIAQNISYSDLAGLPNLFSGDYGDLVNRPTLFSGNYNDLSNKPYIPSIAGLATEQYVDNRWAEPTITGDRFYTDNIEFQAQTNQKVSIVSHVANQRNLVMAIQTTDDVETEALLAENERVTIADDTTAKFSVTYVATSGTDHISFVTSGILSRTGGNITIIGNNNTITTADTGTSWTGNVQADTVNNSLKINVQGTVDSTVDWTIFIEIIEVIR